MTTGMTEKAQESLLLQMWFPVPAQQERRQRPKSRMN